MSDNMILKELREIKALLQGPPAPEPVEQFRDIAQGLLTLIMELETGAEWQRDVDYQRFLVQAAKVKLMIDHLGDKHE